MRKFFCYGLSYEVLPQRKRENSVASIIFTSLPSIFSTYLTMNKILLRHSGTGIPAPKAPLSPNAAMPRRQSRDMPPKDASGGE